MSFVNNITPITQSGNTSFIEKVAPQTPRVAIIGAGITGLIEAYELSKLGYHVDIFEASGKCGGRISSVQNPFGEGGHFDVGAEIIDRNHLGLIKLCHEFGIPLIDRHAAIKGEGLMTANGKRFLDKDMLDSENGQGAYAALCKAIAEDKKSLKDESGQWSEHARALDRLSMDEYLAQKAQQTGTAPEVVDILKAGYTSEIGQDTSHLSALNLIDFIGTDEKQGFSMFGDSDESFAVEGGTARIVDELLKRLDGKVTLHTHQQLHHIVPSANGQKTLHFVLADGTSSTRDYDVVAPAIPMHALAKVNGIEHLGLSPEHINTLQNMQYNQLTKIIVQTKGRPWEHLPNFNGEVTGGGTAFQVAWPSNSELSAATRGENGTLTFLVGGEIAKLPPEELVARCKQDYAAIIGKPVEDVFTPQKGWVMQHWKSGGCYPAPQPGAYIALDEFSRDLGANKELLLAGGYVTAPSDHGTWVGFMHNAAASAESMAHRVAERLPEIAQQKSQALVGSIPHERSA
ncbi:MAG: FAD-dependent oxidoreductase [Rickettsiales bacterium]|nr:FAD-dependent oxidoreductase [Rickettsiales bacterium]